jgi:hypothetical protein
MQSNAYRISNLTPVTITPYRSFSGKLHLQSHWEKEYYCRRQWAWMTHATRYNMTYHEYVEACWRRAVELVEKGTIWKRIKPLRLQQALIDRRFKTIFDSQLKTAIKYSIEERAAGEEHFFGYPKELPPEKRPIYGYLANDPNGIAFDWRLEGYGYVVLRLKDELKARTTYTFEDTMSSTDGGTEPFICPRPLKVPSADTFNCSNQPNWDLHEIFDPLLISSIEEGMQKKYFRYVEVQIHGGVYISNVKEVIFPDKPTKKLRCLLADAGIPYRVQERKYSVI